jgi:hypothetical protein
MQREAQKLFVRPDQASSNGTQHPRKLTGVLEYISLTHTSQPKLSTLTAIAAAITLLL